MDGHNSILVKIKLHIPKVTFMVPIIFCMINKKVVRYISCNPKTMREYIPKNVIIRVKKEPCMAWLKYTNRKLTDVNSNILLRKRIKGLVFVILRMKDNNSVILLIVSILVLCVSNFSSDNKMFFDK